MCDFFLASLAFWILKCWRINYSLQIVDVASVLNFFFLSLSDSFIQKSNKGKCTSPSSIAFFTPSRVCNRNCDFLWCDATVPMTRYLRTPFARAQPLFLLIFGAHKKLSLFCIRPVYFAQSNSVWWKWYSISLNMRTQVDTRHISTENDFRRSAARA